MAYSLRLPDALDRAARTKADALGISINALVCVALDAYLCRPAAPAEAGADRAADSEKPTAQQSTGAQRREFTHQQRLARKAKR